MSKHDTYNRSEKGRARNARCNAKRIRMRAGGIQFYLGRAPSVEVAQTLRTRIREEAPRGTVRES